MDRSQVYLESSVWNCYFNDHTPEMQEQTRRLVGEALARGGTTVFISTVVPEEIGNAPDSRRLALLGLIREVSPRC